MSLRYFKENGMEGSIRKILLLSMLAGMVVGLGVPIFMVGQFPTEFGFLSPRVFFIYSGVIALFVAVSTAVIGLLFSAAAGRRFGVGLSCFILTWVVVAGFLFPLVKTAQMVDAAQTSLSLSSLLIVSVLAIAAAVASTKRLAPAAYIALCVVAVGAVAPAVPTFNSLLFADDDVSGVFEVSEDRNIFVIGFDGIPSNVASDVLEDHPGLAEKFNDFLFFENAISAAPGTRASARTELFGHQDYSELGGDENEIHENLNFDVLPMNHIENAYAHGIYRRYNTQGRGVSANGSMSGSGVDQSAEEHEYWFSLIMARLFSGPAYEKLGLSNVVRIARSASDSLSYGGDVGDRMEQYAGMEWKSNLLVSEGDYFGFVNNLRASKNGLSLRRMHFMHTHFPVDFDAECRFRGDEPDWHERSVNYEALYQQAICEFTQLGMFVDRLRSLGVYNNSLVVLKSDHGEPVRYFDSPPHNLQINDNQSWGFNRYQPLLMIKDAGVERENMGRNADLVSLADLGRTICLAADLGAEHCTQFEGLDLLGEYDVRESPDLYIEVARNVDSSSKFGTHKVVHLIRDGRSFWEMLERSPEVRLTEAADPSADVRSTTGNASIRIRDLRALEEGLESFHDDNGHYPESPRWSGIYSNWGPSTENWIPGLAPEYVESLPRDPRQLQDGAKQYLYKSNGDDYKLIAHGVGNDCEDVRELRPGLVDPERDCWAYGVWTEGARDW